MEAKAGMSQLEKLVQWLERDYPAAAASLREGLEECFTPNRLGVPPFTAPLPGNHQYYRESAGWGADANPASVPLEKEPPQFPHPKRHIDGVSPPEHAQPSEGDTIYIPCPKCLAEIP